MNEAQKTGSRGGRYIYVYSGIYTLNRAVLVRDSARLTAGENAASVAVAACRGHSRRFCLDFAHDCSNWRAEYIGPGRGGRL